MRTRRLTPPQHPDFNEVVVHLTGRTGDESIAQERLVRIISSGTVLATLPFGVNEGAACFTESTSRGVSWLIAHGHFAPYGVAFTKAFLFERGGAPAIPIRGDEWHHVRHMPPSLRARAVRLWPGADADPGETLPLHLTSRSEWLMEREWRVPGVADQPAFRFATEDIAFLVVPDDGWMKRAVRAMTKAGHRPLAERLAKVRWIAIDQSGAIVANNGVKLRR